MTRRGCRPYEDPIPLVPYFASQMECTDCTWSWAGGQFRLKYVNRNCMLHWQLLSTI